MLLKPRFGSRMWSGIWPPSKPLIDTPERALAPFWPRPAVLPRPEPMPRPTRTRSLRAPSLSLISFSFMFVALAFAFVALRRSGDLALNLDHMLHLTDHAANLGSILEFRHAVHLVQAQA